MGKFKKGDIIYTGFDLLYDIRVKRWFAVSTGTGEISAKKRYEVIEEIGFLTPELYTLKDDVGNTYLEVPGYYFTISEIAPESLDDIEVESYTPDTVIPERKVDKLDMPKIIDTVSRKIDEEEVDTEDLLRVLHTKELTAEESFGNKEYGRARSALGEIRVIVNDLINYTLNKEGIGVIDDRHFTTKDKDESPSSIGCPRCGGLMFYTGGQVWHCSDCYHKFKGRIDGSLYNND